jgi:hypothetical protein
MKSQTIQSYGRGLTITPRRRLKQTLSLSCMTQTKLRLHLHNLIVHVETKFSIFFTRAYHMIAILPRHRHRTSNQTLAQDQSVETDGELFHWAPRNCEQSKQRLMISRTGRSIFYMLRRTQPAHWTIGNPGKAHQHTQKLGSLRLELVSTKYQALCLWISDRTRIRSVLVQPLSM